MSKENNSYIPFRILAIIDGFALANFIKAFRIRWVGSPTFAIFPSTGIFRWVSEC